MANGMLEDGIRVTAAVRDRYDGDRRNPWNEIECGSNYARSMASWGAMIVLAGFSFDATRGHVGFAPRLHAGGLFRSFWSGANAWGRVELGEGQLRLEVLGGDLLLSSLGLPPGSGAVAGAKRDGKKVDCRSEGDSVLFDGLALGPGAVLTLVVPGLSLLGLPDLASL